MTFDDVVICFAGFSAQFIIEGIMLSFVVYSPILIEYFETSVSNITLMGSLACGLWFILGPLASLLTSRYGYMTVEVIAGVLCTVGCVGASFSTEPWMIIVFFGIIFGCGAGIGFLPAVSAAPTHFKDEHLRHFVATVLTVGGAAGGIFFPFMFQLLLENNPWQYGFAMTGAITMQLIVCGAVFSMVRISTGHPMQVVEAPRIAFVVDITDSISNVSSAAGHCIGEDDTFSQTNTSAITRDNQASTRTIARDNQTYMQYWEQVPNKTHIFMFFLNCVAWNIGYFVWFAALPLFLTDEGYTESDVTSLFSYMGILIVTGRILASIFVVIFPNTDKIIFYNAVCAMSGVTIALYLIPLGYSAYLIYSILYGLLFGAQTAIMPSVCIHLVSIKHLNSVLGIILPASGIGGFIGPLLTGGILDQYNSYAFCFGVASAFIITSFIVMLPSHFLYLQDVHHVHHDDDNNTKATSTLSSLNIHSN